MLKAVLINYNFIPTWLLDSGLDYVIYDRSNDKTLLKDFDQSKIIYEENIGNVDFPKLSYLIENYDSLPDVFLWGKTNLFKYISKEEYDKVKDNKVFTPLLTQKHRGYYDEFGLLCYYDNGIYHERNSIKFGLPFFYAETYAEYAKIMGFPSPDYLAFVPGGNYILTRETVHKHPKELYEKMRSMLPYTKEPAEAQFAERSYYYLWK